MKRWWMLWLLLVLSPMAAAEADGSGAIMVPNPSADLWRAVRQRGTVEPGRSQIPGMDSGVLVNATGEEFRDYRRERFLRYAGWALPGALGLILLFHLLHGAIGYRPSGRRILRFDLYDRIAHWLLASVFLFLGFSGLILAFGRFAILPWSGKEAFSVLASAMKEGHNLFGPLFIVALLWVIARFLARNWPSRDDLVWLLKGGGFFGKGHVSAGFFNGGEKFWFWLLLLGGLALSASGLVLDFPFLAPGRDALILALVVHGLAAVLLLVFAFGHIYVGTIGVKGTLQGMTTGEVDEAWAEAHHDRWLAELREGRAAAQQPVETTVTPSSQLLGEGGS